MGTTKFSHAVGYRGVCKLAGTTLLATSGNITLSQDPIMSSGVWGAGYQNIAPLAYAFNYLTLEGNAGFELTLGSGDVWGTLKDCCITDRTAQKEITLWPDGKNGFNGNGWCSSVSFEANEGAAVTGSFNFKGDPSDGGITASGEGDTSATGTGIGTDLAGATLVPYWQTSMSVNGTQRNDIISWSANYNSDLQFLKCCNYQENAPIAADYILAGEATSDGNYTVFRITGDFDPSGVFHTEQKNILFKVGTSHSIGIPQALVTQGSTSITTGASYVSTEFSYSGLGDGTNPPLDMN